MKNSMLKYVRTKIIFGATMTIFLLVPSALQAQSGADAQTRNNVVATVDGVDITEDELAFAAEDLAQDLRSVPPEEQRAFLVSVLIDMKLMANAARAQSLHETEIFVRRLRYLEERALRRAYFASRIDGGISDADVRTEYNAFVATQSTEEELHARHILLATIEDAQGVIAELEAGRGFEDVAREKSTGPSGPNGGDLGFFGRGRMVKEFEDAAFALEVGQISDPIQTQFGWHVIKLEERRQSALPAFEQLEGQIRQRLLIEEFDAAVNELKQSAQITIVDPAFDQSAASN